MNPCKIIGLVCGKRMHNIRIRQVWRRPSAILPVNTYDYYFIYGLEDIVALTKSYHFAVDTDIYGSIRDRVRCSFNLVLVAFSEIWQCISNIIPIYIYK